MRHRRLYKSHRYLPVFLFARMLFFSLILSLLCSIFCFFALPPTAFSQGIIPVQINGLTQPPGFTPALLTLHVNETVMFINNASPAHSYTLHADDGSFSSPAIPTGGHWTITFHTPGSHTYRDASATQTMVGELLVVDKGASLLATPNPFVEATVTALIKNGQNPPDIFIIAMPRHATPPANSLIPLIILIAGISISLTLLSMLGVSYYKRYRQRVATTSDKDEEDDKDEDLTKIKKKDEDEDLTKIKKKDKDEDDNEDTDSHARIQQIRTVMDNLKKRIQARSHFLSHKEDDDKDDDEDDVLINKKIFDER